MYNFKDIEPEILKFWKDKKIIDKARNRNKKGPKFYFLQGPPYTSGRLHIAHAWNNSLKDISLRYKRMKGFDVWDRAGYDMHGLPTENAVQKLLGLKDKNKINEFGVEKFIKECIKFSTQNAKLMDQDLLRLGIWMDYENAYYPIKNEFIEGEWWLIKKAYEAKRLYKGKKIMHWCSSCETALAKHELEYENVKEESVFLKFKSKDNPKEFLIVWTTTPWTIFYNLAVMVNPKLDYVKAQVGNETWIVAKALVGALVSGVVNKDFKILEEFKGKKLLDYKYVHPFYEELKKQFNEIKSKNLHTVILSEQYVDLSAGSGLVHCAPGCGPEDFEIGQKYDLPPFNNLNEQGVFENMGKYSGFIAKKDDKKFVEELEKKGSLIAITEVEHEYAHCWRCKNPVVFRATEQWFMKIEDLIPDMLKANKNVKWQPKTGTRTFSAWVEALKDNSIARQRYWGAPVPIWECSKCGNVIVIGSVKELKQHGAKDIPKDLHRPWIDNVKLKCKCGEKISRIADVIDVWIDAGTTSWNCLYYPLTNKYFKKYFPADFILEATEQIRLWFSMLLICSMIALKKPCYKNVYMHGMILDYQGMKMSKSLGNIISPYEVIDKYGADILRYYMCGTTAGENINFNWEEVKQKQRNILVLWNLHKFVSDLADEIKVNPDKIKKFNKVSIEEKYILSKLNSTIEGVTELFDNYKLDETISKIEELFLELSRTYIHFVRDKSSVGDKKEKELVLAVIYNVLLENLKLFSLICPFITEKIYQNLKEKFKLKQESIHLFDWPKANKKLINKSLENNIQLAKQVIQEILAQREKAQLGVRWPLSSAEITIEDEKAIKSLSEIIKTQTNIKNLKIKKGKLSVKLDIKLTPELEMEGFTRELTRRIQNLRKKAGLKKTDKIELVIFSDYDIGKFKKELQNKVGAKILNFEKPKKKYTMEAKEQIKGKNFEICFRKL